MISILVFLIVVGVILYLVNLLPMDATIKKIVMILAVLFCVLYLLQVLGLWHGMPAFRS